jgi:hypothetical protein
MKKESLAERSIRTNRIAKYEAVKKIISSKKIDSVKSGRTTAAELIHTLTDEFNSIEALEFNATIVELLSLLSDPKVSKKLEYPKQTAKRLERLYHFFASVEICEKDLFNFIAYDSSSLSDEQLNDILKEEGIEL